MINFMNEIEKDKKKKTEMKKITESTDYKLRLIREKKEEAKDICLDTLLAKIYKNAVPMDDVSKDAPYSDLDNEIMQFMKAKSPKGTSFYVKEAIKKGSKPAKALMESVNKMLTEIFSGYALNINEVSSDDIVFDVNDPETSEKLDEISANMEFDELSDAIQNNVKTAANGEIARVKEERMKIKELEDSLKEDEGVETESAINRELAVRGVISPETKFYQPTLFEGVMINKLNTIKESGVDMTQDSRNKLAFVESVKEFTKLSILKSLMLESFSPEDTKN